ncbi:MAG: DUF177 domain-containing protein [Sandaracinaceae bacterium]|nr:DUF177 domain-containing protein [Sandaracinaceae bacterium]
MAEFEIKVHELENGGKSYDLPVDPSWLDRVLDTPDLRAAPDANGRATFFASLSGTDVIIRGRLRTAVIAPCARCLADTRIAVDTDLTALFSRAGGDARPLPEELELTPEDLDRETYSGDTLSLDEIVREQVVLEVPMQVHCSEECPGLSVPEHVRGPASLTDAPLLDGKPIDPRFAPLLGLRDAVASDAASDAGSKKNKKRAS